MNGDRKHVSCQYEEHPAILALLEQGMRAETARKLTDLLNAAEEAKIRQL